MADDVQGWVRTICLGVAVGVAYGDLRIQVGQLQDDIRGLKMEVRQIAHEQAVTGPVIERLQRDVLKLDERVDLMRRR